MSTHPYTRFLLVLVFIFSLNACGGSGDSAPVAESGQPGQPSQPAGDPTPAVDLSPAFGDMDFSRPTALVQSPVDLQRWYVLEKAGVIRTFTADQPVSGTVFMDLSGRVATDDEGGLLNMVFAPDFADSGEVYIYYTGPGAPLISHLSRFISADGGLSADPDSEIGILSLDQPFANHNGGWLAFGPHDGFLYLGLGDGGSGGDPHGNGQDTGTLLGTILRVDVGRAEGAASYAIPSENPFYDSPGCEAGGACREIFAWGFRNPWRGGFDPVTGSLWIGDVGQEEWEEIDLVEKGRNYGWNILEGTHCYDADNCDSSGLALPVFEYGHDVGESITGGYIYRGGAISGLVGDYIFGDFITGRIWRLVDAANGGRRNELLLDTGLMISTFAQDDAGEIYVVDYSGGRVYRLTSAGGS